MKAIIESIEKKQMKDHIPTFRTGDTLEVKVRVKEGNRERLQSFEGVVIVYKKRGLNSAFILRKIAHGEGVERTFQLHSPLIESIIVKKHGDVRRARLFYIRGLTGKKARIKHKIIRKTTAKQDNS